MEARNLIMANKKKRKERYKLVYENSGMIRGSRTGIPAEQDVDIIERAVLEGLKDPTPMPPGPVDGAKIYVWFFGKRYEFVCSELREAPYVPNELTLDVNGLLVEYVSKEPRPEPVSPHVEGDVFVLGDKQRISGDHALLGDLEVEDGDIVLP